MAPRSSVPNNSVKEVATTSKGAPKRNNVMIADPRVRPSSDTVSVPFRTGYNNTIIAVPVLRYRVVFR